MKRTVLLLLTTLMLTGCARQNTEDNKFEKDLNAFCDRIVEIDSSINAISNETGDEEGLAAAKEDLLDCLGSLNDEFAKFANMDFPTEYDYLE